LQDVIDGIYFEENYLKLDLLTTLSHEAKEFLRDKRIQQIPFLLVLKDINKVFLVKVDTTRYEENFVVLEGIIEEAGIPWEVAKEF
jgi:predicted house-cleaning noncanonical NTP pyrophosphatase (MazG superfamily)